MISEDALNLIFRDARTHSKWLPRDVPNDQLKAVWDLTKLAPTSANTMPMRAVFVKSPAAKEKLKPFLEGSNVEKTMAAPVCAILAFDLMFWERIPTLYPHAPQFADYFKGPEKAEYARIHAFRNATLQGAYFILAARALGLDCGPMSGFDNAKLDESFFPDGRWKSNFLVNLGHGDASKLRPRNPRLSFEDACSIV